MAVYVAAGQIGSQTRSSPLTWIAVACGIAFSALVTEIGADARWLAAIGAHVARVGTIPTSIPYAAAPSHHWYDAPVLGQLVFHELEASLGDRGLVLAQLVAVTIALLALAVDMRRARANDLACVGVVLALFLAAPGALLVVRAQLFSLALFPILVLLLRCESRKPSRRVWLAVPLFVLWANLHGGVLVGVATAGIYAALQRGRRDPRTAAGVLVASAAAVFATPVLLHTGDYYAGVFRGAAAESHYGLWAPLSLDQPLDLAFLAVAVPLLVLALRARPARWELVALAALAVLAVLARRNEVWLLLFAATPAARGLSRRTTGAPALSRRLTLVCSCIPALMLVIALVKPPAPTGAGASLIRETGATAAGTPILADALNGEKLAVGGDTIWIGNPLDAFDRRDQILYLDWLRGLPAGDVLLRRPIRVVLVAAGSDAQRRLARDPAFAEADRDAQAVLYRRR